MSLEATVLAMLVALPGAAPAHTETIADAVAEASEGDRLLAAELIAVGFFESGFTPRIQAGGCYSYECDKGKARSYWQMQKTSFTHDTWNSMVGLDHEGILIAAQTAGNILLAGRKACKSVSGTLSWYATGRCRWAGARHRVKLVNRLMAVD